MCKRKGCGCRLGVWVLLSVLVWSSVICNLPHKFSAVAIINQVIYRLTNSQRYLRDKLSRSINISEGFLRSCRALDRARAIHPHKLSPLTRGEMVKVLMQKVNESLLTYDMSLIRNTCLVCILLNNGLINSYRSY